MRSALASGFWREVRRRPALKVHRLPTCLPRAARFLASALLFSALVPSRAEASSSAVGSTYVQRPLTLPQGVLELNAGPRRPYFGGQVAQAGQLQWTARPNASDSLTFVPGAAYGVLPNVEVGVVWPLLLAPDLSLSDISFYGQYELSSGKWDVAGYGELRVPIESDLELTAGLPVQLHLSSQLRVDTGAYFRMVLQDPVLGVVHLPLGLVVQVSEEFALGPELAVELIDFEELNVPLGMLGIFSLTNGLSTTADLVFRLGFVDLAQGFEQVRFDAGVQLYFGG